MNTRRPREKRLRERKLRRRRGVNLQTLVIGTVHIRHYQNKIIASLLKPIPCLQLIEANLHLFLAV